MHLRRGFYRARRVTDGFVKVVPREGRCFMRILGGNLEFLSEQV